MVIIIGSVSRSWKCRWISQNNLGELVNYKCQVITWAGGLWEGLRAEAQGESENCLENRRMAQQLYCFMSTTESSTSSCMQTGSWDVTPPHQNWLWRGCVHNKLPVKGVNTVCSENSSLLCFNLIIFFSHAEISAVTKKAQSWYTSRAGGVEWSHIKPNRLCWYIHTQTYFDLLLIYPTKWTVSPIAFYYTLCGNQKVHT